MLVFFCYIYSTINRYLFIVFKNQTGTAMGKIASLKFNIWKRDLLHLIYPQQCIICDVETNLSDLSICPICISELNYTHFEKYTEPTPLDKIFWGRIPLQASYALLRFKKAGNTQQLLHELKYKNNPEVGVYFGKEIGTQLLNIPAFSDADALVPVPLHARKKFIRGYNQAAVISKGIAATSQIPLREDILKRTSFTESQTKKNRNSRWENMQNRFQIKRKKSTSFNHLILVDDVVTTGSTLETCLRILKAQFPHAKLSVVLLAMAE